MLLRIIFEVGLFSPQALIMLAFIIALGGYNLQVALLSHVSLERKITTSLWS